MIVRLDLDVERVEEQGKIFEVIKLMNCLTNVFNDLCAKSYEFFILEKIYLSKGWAEMVFCVSILLDELWEDTTTNNLKVVLLEHVTSIF